MKKILFLFLVSCLFISCSDDALTSDTTPPLQKVIFNVSSSSSNQRHWNFNDSGLLYQITDGDQIVLQTFSYDSNGRVINSTLYNPNGTHTDFSFAYNDDGSVYSLNNVALNFDTTLGAYYFGDLNSNYRIFKLNPEGLLTYSKSGGVEIDETGTIPYTVSQASAGYADSNLKSMSFQNGTTFNGFEHDTHLNPLRNGTLAVFKAFAVTGYDDQWLNSFAVSKNNVIRKDYPSEYYIHEEYVYDFNSEGMPVSATMNFYEMNHLDFTNTAILYYYQGDVLP